MLGRNGNIAYVRYNSQGRIVPGGPIISAKRPSVGFWQPVSYAIGNSVTSNSLRAFVRIDAYGRVVPSSLLLLAGAPSTADSGTSWLEINATYIPYVPTTTTTTTIPISTTTTTTLIPSSTTTTTTGIPGTTTTTTTQSDAGAIDFSISYTCVGNSIEVTMSQFSIVGKPLGLDSCYPSITVYLTEAAALAGSFSTIGANYYTQFKFTVPSPLVTTTYWVAAKDMTNPNNKLAKSFTVTPCPQVPYNSLYVGFRPINTVWVTFN